MAGQLRVDEITDEAGTGSPDFVNGVKVAGVVQTAALPDPGAAGEALVSTGTAWTSGNAGGNYIMQTLTSPGTWTKPAGLKAVKVTVIGGGGGGGGCRSEPGPYGPRGNAAAHGAGGGGSIRYIPAPSIPGPVVVTVGAGGAGGPAPGTNTTLTAGAAGGTSSFGAFLSATGGAGAGNSYGPVPTPTRGIISIGGAGSSGDLNAQGNSGAKVVPDGIGGPSVIFNNAARINNYSGGAAIFGSPRLGEAATGDGTAGFTNGDGGTGANILSGAPLAGRSGGNGAGGVVFVEEFY